VELYAINLHITHNTFKDYASLYATYLNHFLNPKFHFSSIKYKNMLNNFKHSHSQVYNSARIIQKTKMNTANYINIQKLVIHSVYNRT